MRLYVIDAGRLQNDKGAVFTLGWTTASISRSRCLST